MKRGSSLLGILALTFTAGCDSCSKPAPDSAALAADAAPATPSVDAAPASKLGSGDGGAFRQPWLAVPGATAAILPNMGIPDRFNAEQKARPANIKPNVESVLAALETAGLTVVDKKQHLGQTFGARYCVGARVVRAKDKDKDAGETGLLQLSVCEFISPEVAVGSRDYSTEALKLIPNRSIHAKNQTTLTIRDESPVTPEIEAAAAKAFAAYDAL